MERDLSKKPAASQGADAARSPHAGDPRELVLDIGKTQLSALAWGPQDGRPLLGLHGWLDNAATFSRIAPFFPDRFFVSLDLCGHGHSQHRPSGHPYSFVDSVDDVLAVLDELKWSKPDVIGHSMGGGIATLLAGAFPERVGQLHLIEALGPLTADDDSACLRLRHGIEKLQQHRRKKSPTQGYPNPEIPVQKRAQAGHFPIESARVLVDRALEERRGSFFWRTDPALRLPSFVRFNEAQTMSFLRAIRSPVNLILAKNGDPHVQEFILRRLEALKSEENASLFQKVEVEGSHHPHLDFPEEVAQIINTKG